MGSPLSLRRVEGAPGRLEWPLGFGAPAWSQRLLAGLLAVACGCGAEPAEPLGAVSREAPVASAPSRGLCALLSPEEVAELIGVASIGIAEDLGGGASSCMWPVASSLASPESQSVEAGLILQMGPSSSMGLLAAIDLGSGYRAELVSERPPIAATMEIGELDLVAVIAIEIGARTLMLSPLSRPIPRESPEFERLVELLTTLNQRID